MLKISDINILKEYKIYLNSKGKRVKREPKTCIGAFYHISAGYRNLVYESMFYIPTLDVKNENFIKENREKLMDKILKELSSE